MLVVIAVLLALNCAVGLRGTADAQSSGAKFGYIHIGDEILLSGTVGQRDEVYGMAVYDLRNGNMWGFPILSPHPRPSPRYNPVYLGTFDFSALDNPVRK